MSRTGRPQRPHQPSDGGDPIVGLYHCPDGRWRINATGEKFTEKNEQKAIERFLAWKRAHGPSDTVTLGAAMKSDFGNAKTIATSEGVSVKLKQTQAEAIQRKVSEEFEGSDMRFKAREVRIGYEIPKEVAYASGLFGSK